MNDPRDARPAGAVAGKSVALTMAALVCFALNSLLCRAALGSGLIDAMSFTLARLGSGAMVLFLIATLSPRTTAAPHPVSAANIAGSAVALFLYALPFSLAYLRIPAGTGAFVVFCCVQITMIGWDLANGGRLRAGEVAGLGLALFGLGWLTRPGVGSPDTTGVLLMGIAGVSWGIYSIRGRRSGPPLRATARNFAASIPLALVASLVALAGVHVDGRGLLLAVLSCGVTSGLGYVAWYAALPSLSPTRASIVQLAVPPLASALGVLLLGEVLSPRLLQAAPLILGGIAIAVKSHRA
jgi:drug/metabolite transporter (DMT)-like permease